MPPSAKIQALETLLRDRGHGRALPKPDNPIHPPAPTGFAEADQQLGGGLPRGAISEIHGSYSSGRTGLLFSVLARATQAGETTAYIDATDCLDPRSAEQAGIVLERLLWVRCDPREKPRYERLALRQAQADQAWQAANLIASAGGFGVIALDLGGLSQRRLSAWRRRPWVRLLRAIENTSTVLTVLSEERLAGTAASASIGLRREQTEWDGLLGEVEVRTDVMVRRTIRTLMPGLNEKLTA